MAKRGYKLQEFVAHAGNVNCLSFGKKNCRVFITGGDDQKVNLWSVGKPTSLMSLCGHTSPIESATFDSTEVLVVAGSSSGAIKLWDLEETKLVRTLTGHRSYCTAVEFHPFGEFFASGSMDTNLKIWDIRKKGCIHTYKGHTRGISTIRFSPDGRWVVSGGFDNVVKVWDLTAGKLLHDFKFHEGHIRSIEFHPLEFLLATGSADKTVKFWDLETFEMIGSSRREAAGVRSVTFHPDGKSLFCGLDDSIKVYSWEPVICHDSVDVGWSTLGDICIHDGKLLGGAYYENSVALWVADVSLIEPYSSKLATEKHIQPERKCDSQKNLSEKEETLATLKSNLRSTTPDSDSKEIKTIHVDPAGISSVTSKSVVDLHDTPKVVLPPDPKDTSTVGIQKRSPAVGLSSDTSKAVDLHDTPKDVHPSDPKDVSTVRIQKQSPAVSLSLDASKSVDLHDTPKDAVPHDPKDVSTVSIQKRSPAVGLSTVASKSVDLHDTPKDAVPHDPKDVSSVRIQKRSPAVGLSTVASKPLDLHDTPKIVLPTDPKDISTVGIQKQGPAVGLSSVASKPLDLNDTPKVPSDRKDIRTVRIQKRRPAMSSPEKGHVSVGNRSIIIPNIVPRDGPDGKAFVGSRRDSLGSAKTSNGMSANPRPRRLSNNPQKTSVSLESVPRDNLKSPLGARKDSSLRSRVVSDENAKESSEGRQASIKTVVEKHDRTSSPETVSSTGSGDQTLMSSKAVKPVRVVNGVAVMHGRTRSLVERFEKREKTDVDEKREKTDVDETSTPYRDAGANAEPVESPSQINSVLGCAQNSNEQINTREVPSLDDNSIIENLMQNHDVLLSSFRSRLTKLQVVRHFWERNDAKGAIEAVRKLPDRSVQADVVGVLIDRMEIITLDLFSCLLPVLSGLLEGKVERHATISLEMLLKLVAVFGSVVRSTVSAPKGVGVDLHAEERRECCRRCFTHLQSIENFLPEVVMRGGVVARCAQQLKLVLQQL